MLPSAPTRRFWVTLISVSVALRAIVGLGVLGDMPIFSDAGAYSNQAHDLLHPPADGYPYYWPPGTSYLLAASYWLFGEHAWAARVAMIAVSTLSVVTGTLLALRLARDARGAMLSGWILALYPGMWLMVAEPFSFDLTLLLVTVTVLFSLRAWETGRLLDYLVAGLALGAAGLTRPGTLSIALGLAACAAVVLWRRRTEGEKTGIGRFAIGTAVLGVSAIAVLVPVLAHNSEHDQGLTLSVANELNVWIGNNPYTPAYRTDQIGQHPIEDFPDDQQPYLERFSYGTEPTREERSETLDEAQRFVTHHPATTLLRTANRARAFWGFDYTISNLVGSEWDKGRAAEAASIVLEVGGYGLLVLLVIIGVVFARDLLRPGALWFLGALIVAFALPYVLAYAAGRWHYPVLGLLAVPAGAGAAWLLGTPDRWTQIRMSRAFWIATSVFLLLQLEYAYFTATTNP